MATEPLESALPPGPAGTSGADEGPDGKLRYHDIKGNDLGPADDSGAPQAAQASSASIWDSPDVTPAPAAKSKPASIWDDPEVISADQVKKTPDVNVYDAVLGKNTALAAPLPEPQQKELSAFKEMLQGHIASGGKQILDTELHGIHVIQGSPLEKLLQQVNPNFKGGQTSEEAEADREGQAINKPLVDAGQFVDKDKHPMMKAIMETASSLTSPANVAIMAGSGGLGLVESPAKLAVANKLISAGFAAQSIGALYSHSEAFRKAYDEGDATEAKYQITHALLSGSIGLMAGAHAAGMQIPLVREGGITEKAVANAKDFAKSGVDLVSKPFKGEDLESLYSSLAKPTKKENAGGEFDDKIKEALPALSEVIDHNPHVQTPAEMSDAIEHYRSSREATIMSQAEAVRGTPQAEMPGIADETIEAIEKGFREQSNRYTPDQESAAIHDVLEHYRLKKTINGQTRYDAEPDLFEVENARQRFNDDTAPAAFGKTKEPLPPATEFAKQIAANVARSRIDAKYDELGISGVKEWRRQESAIIDVRENIAEQTELAKKMGQLTPWNAFVKQIGWKALLSAAAGGSLGSHFGFEGGAIGAAVGAGSLVGEAFREWKSDQNKNPNALLQRIVEKTVEANEKVKAAGGKINPKSPEFGAAKVKPPVRPVQGPQTQGQVSGVRLPVTQGPLEEGATAVRSPLEAAVEAGNGVEPTGSGVMQPSDERMDVPANHLPEGHTQDSFHHHELGHFANAVAESTKVSDIASHQHAEIQGRAAGGIGYEDKPIIKQRNAVGRYTPEELIEDTRKWLSNYVAGAVANELIDGMPIHENSGLVGDIRQMKELLKRHGIEGNEAIDEIEMAVDRARKNLNKPGVLDTIKSNAQVREENLHPTLHYSRGRLMNMAEQLRGLDENPNPEGTEGQRPSSEPSAPGAAEANSAPRATDTEGGQARREAAQDDSGRVGTANDRPQVKYKPSEKAVTMSDKRADLGPEFDSAQRQHEIDRNKSILRNSKATEEERRIATNNLADLQDPDMVAARAYLKGGVKEHSTGFEEADKAIREGGGIPGGLFGDREGTHVKMFHDGESGTTLGFTNKEEVTPEAVRKKLSDSRFEYKALQPDGWAKEAEHTAKESGGFTIKPGTDKSGVGSVPKDGFMVELHPEARETLDRTPTARDIFEFAKKNKALLESHPELHVGGYGQELNISARFSNEAKATEAAKKLDQISIWDVKGAKEIPTGGSSSAGPFNDYPAEQRHADLGPEKTPFSGTHYSKVERDVLRGDERGSAVAGEESARLQHDNKVPGVYAYREGVKPEEQIAARAFKYAIKGDKAIADIGGKEEGLMQDAFTQAFDKYKAAGENDIIAQQKALNDAEAHLRDIGYDGYERNGSTFLYGDQPVHRSPLEGEPKNDIQAELAKTREESRAERRHEMAEEFEKAFNGGRSPLEGDRVSTRVTSGKKATENHMEGEPLTINRAALDDRLRTKFAGKMQEIPGVKIPSNIKDPAKVTDRAVRHFADNLKHIFGLVPKDKQIANGKWYESAHNMTKDIAGKYELSHPQVAGVTAALSPQMDWDMNVAQMKRLVDTVKTKQDFAVTPEMVKTGRDIVNRSRAPQSETAKPANQRLEGILDKDIVGKKFSDLTDMYDKAAFIRLYDETYGNPDFPRIDPGTGEERELRTNNNGSPARLAWGNLDNISKALSIMEDGSRENISSKIGDSHKVRNFYNNIIDPTNPDDVTIDTHAVAAATLLPLGGDGTEVLDNFGKAGKSLGTGVKGTYPIYADGYRLAAKELGVLPRALQSVTWEKIRDLFPAEWKTEENLGAVKNIWKEHQDGEITGAEARTQITDMAAKAQAEVAVKRAAKNAAQKSTPIKALDFLEALGHPAFKGYSALSGRAPQGAQ